MQPSIRPSRMTGRSVTLLLAVLAAIEVAALGCQSPGGRRVSGSRGDGLTPEEERVAVDVASRSVGVQSLQSRGKLFMTDVDLFRDKAAAEKNPKDRRAIVSFYRYEGDLTVLSIVDLQSREVVQVDSIPHLPTPLSREEFVRAKDLAMAEPNVRTSLGEKRSTVEIEALLSRSGSERDPLFGHRVVRLLFRRGSDYLTLPIVHVDLTTGTVHVDTSGGHNR